MSIAILVMLVMMCTLFGVVGLVAYKLGTRSLPPASGSDRSPRLSDQDERIELLEDELQRLRDQADFTEKLLTERGSAEPGDAPGEDTPD